MSRFCTGPQPRKEQMAESGLKLVLSLVVFSKDQNREFEFLPTQLTDLSEPLMLCPDPADR